MENGKNTPTSPSEVRRRYKDLANRVHGTKIEVDHEELLATLTMFLAISKDGSLGQIISFNGVRNLLPPEEESTVLNVVDVMKNDPELVENLRRISDSISVIGKGW